MTADVTAGAWGWITGEGFVYWAVLLLAWVGLIVGTAGLLLFLVEVSTGWTGEED